jgi:hypothetical protein
LSISENTQYQRIFNEESCVSTKTEKTLKPLKATKTDDLAWRTSPAYSRGTKEGPDTPAKPIFYRNGVLLVLSQFPPGSRHHPHAHGFPQVNYILEGEFTFNGETHGPGTIVEVPELTRYEIVSETGGLRLVIQYPAPDGTAPFDRTIDQSLEGGPKTED